ncbi:hypothetical protein TSAR_012551 [Trichomalopsis sarcophagae]|uniref:Uncharacterized protein n=1 Tax=Trichomalopsis sarcophagae TaxID=543379 RepID=A0A232EV78_9HYME|nr:hypothetical protein TSAR_012551 [Trichomalopsis sarcophagae]
MLKISQIRVQERKQDRIFRLLATLNLRQCSANCQCPVAEVKRLVGELPMEEERRRPNSYSPLPESPKGWRPEVQKTHQAAHFRPCGVENEFPLGP